MAIDTTPESFDRAVSVHRCPVCKGRGFMPSSFYDKNVQCGYERCRACNGTGIIVIVNSKPKLSSSKQTEYPKIPKGSYPKDVEPFKKVPWSDRLGKPVISYQFQKEHFIPCGVK